LEALKSKAIWSSPDRVDKEFRACLQTLLEIDAAVGELNAENESLKQHIRDNGGGAGGQTEETMIRTMAASIYTHAVSSMVDTYALDFTAAKLRSIRDNAYDAARGFFAKGPLTEDED